MIHPDNETSRISALDIVKSIDGMLDTSSERQMRLAQEINDDLGIPLSESFKLAANAVSKVIAPMLCKEDVKIYNQAKRLLNIAETYGSELLKKYMLSYIKDEKVREKVANMIVRQLVWLYPDHAFAIRRDELRDWFFRVDDAEGLPYWQELWDIYKANVGSNSQKKIEFLSL